MDKPCGKIIFNRRYVNRWGIRSMDIGPEFIMTTSIGWIYIYKPGNTDASCRLRTNWVRSAYYYKNNEKVSVFPRPDGKIYEGEIDDDD